MAGKSLHVRTLQRALDVLGGGASIARRLGISQTRLKLYLEDLQPIPQTLFLTLVQILADDGVARLLKEAEEERRLLQFHDRKPTTPRILLAVRPEARAPFEAALGDEAELLTAETLEDAKRLIESSSDIHLVCSTLYFDERRMFDLLVWMQVNHRSVPVICARAFDNDVGPFSSDAVDVAAQGMGARAFVDYPTLLREHGTAAAPAVLKTIVTGHLTDCPTLPVNMGRSS